MKDDSVPGTSAKSRIPDSKLLHALGAFNRVLVFLLSWAAIIAMAALVLDVVLGVFTRHWMGEQAKWTEELARFLLIWCSLLGGAIAFRNKEHLGIDFVVTGLNAEVRKGLKIFTEILTSAVVTVVLIFGGVNLVRDALILEQTTPALQWQMGHVYLVVPIVGIILLLFSIEFIWILWHSDPRALYTQAVSGDETGQLNV